MYVDLMSPYNYLQVNTKLANVLNLNCAVYWAELLNVYARVINKKRDELLDNEGYFDLDRKYITSRTTLSVEDQLHCDAAFEKLEIVFQDPQNPNRIKIDIEKMYALIVEDDPSVIKGLQKKAKLKRDDETAVKRAMVRNNLQLALTETDAELLDALKVWIEAVIEAKKPITKASVEIYQKNLNSYTDNKAVKLRIIEISTANSWVEFAYARDCYEKNYKHNGAFIGAQQKQNIGIDPNKKF